VGDRTGLRLVPAHAHARPAASGRERPALRRLADDPLRPEDLAGDGRAASRPPARSCGSAESGSSRARAVSRRRGPRGCLRGRSADRPARCARAPSTAITCASGRGGGRAR
jgi:hypothetical protein